jgi:rhodanese-related sulfurtransferase
MTPHAHLHSPGFLALVEEVRPRIRETGVDGVRALRAAGRPFHLIDVREDREWKRGRIPGAIHIGRGVLERDIEARIPDREDPIVLYCGGGYRSALAAESLGRMGYTEVRSMEGGWRAWSGAGHEVESDGHA